ncbi:MAG: murein biosynthesis integral membrane protein MurJ [Clostridia bacterium]|nr:murein biosynthesis integral membrane protein MurJ [Clostridia bacterium]
MLNVKNVFKTAGFMVCATLLAKVLGMYREVLFASLYGTDFVAQAFSTASRIPLLFFDIALGAAISSAFIPVFNEYLEKGQKEEALRYSNTFLNGILIITGAICVLGAVFAGPIVSLIGGGLAEETKELATQLVVILFPTMLFTAFAYAIAGILQSFGEFNVPAAISLVSNGIMVVYLMTVGKGMGIHGIAVAMLIGWGFQVIVQIPSLVKKKYKYRPILDLKNEGIRKSARLALPILISSWVQPINSMININLASGLNGGQAVPALDYANKLYIIFVGVLTYAISNMLFPSMSRLAVNEDKTEFKTVVLKAVRAVIVIVVPVMVLFLVLRTELIQFVFERGEFGPESTALTAQALLFYSFGMVGFGVQEIMNKAFYSTQDGKTPMWIAMGGISLNIVLCFVMVKAFGAGLGGLALSASVAAVVIAALLLLVFHRKYRLLDRSFVVLLLKLLVCGAFTAAGTFAVAQACAFGGDFLGKLLSIAVPGAAGLIIYLLMTILLRVDEVCGILSILRHKR